MPNLSGQMLGKVRVDMFLAKGGMAEVFIGTHTTLHRAVAIKFLKGDLQDEPELRERFEREARVIAMLRHPNIVQIHDFDTFENQPYLVMEYVPGASLSTYLRDLHKKDQRLNVTLVNTLLKKLASALKYAHDNDVVHRDVKPANILLTSRTTPISVGQPLPEDAEPILTDFGLVRFTQSSKQTSVGTITGTPAYMSPEQARGERVDARTDVYSLGVTVYEMLAGRVPFDSDSTLSLLHQQIYDPPPPIPGISEELQDVMSRALTKDPEERFRTPLEFAEAFEDALEGTTEAATMLLTNPSAVSNTLSRTGAKDRRVPPARSNFWMFAILGVAVIGLILAGALMLPRGTSEPTTPQPTDTETHHGAATNPAAVTENPVEPAPLADPIGLLRFQDATALADQVTLSTSTMPLPPEGNQYEAWLIEDNGEQRVSIGVITFSAEGVGSLSFVHPQGNNLIGQYHALEITVEPNPDNNPIPSPNVAFKSTLPVNGFTHVRHLLYAYIGNPDNTGFIDGLDVNTRFIKESADDMLTAFQSGDEAAVRVHAERMLNVIVGEQSTDYRDWNGDGTVDDPSDGFGLLLNGDNEGYLQGSLSHAGFAASAEDATENMVVHGEHVIIAVTNVSEWTPQLRDQLIAILNASAGAADLEAGIRQAVALTGHIRNGVDINGNENIEPIPGEGGAVTAYQHAYYMADITIFPNP